MSNKLSIDEVLFIGSLRADVSDVTSYLTACAGNKPRCACNTHVPLLTASSTCFGACRGLVSRVPANETSILTSFGTTMLGRNRRRSSGSARLSGNLSDEFVTNILGSWDRIKGRRWVLLEVGRFGLVLFKNRGRVTTNSGCT
ncbi:hypothetical protein SARC_11595, partial [Sphaeroforma arctica JP610]